MAPGDGIARAGFRRWYERQLIEGHLYLVTCFLCMILTTACLEAANFRSLGLQPALMVAIGGAGALVGIVSWQRYRVIMARAELIGEQSTCANCHTYAAFNVTASGTVDADPAPGAIDLWLRVRCRKCGHEWRIE